MLEGHHFQNAYVTRDVDKWVSVFEQQAKVDRILRHEGTTTLMTASGPATQTTKLALIWVGDLQYELIQPVAGDVALYTDKLPPDDGLAFHHICMRVPDWDSFRARVDRQTYPVVIERSGGDALNFLYLDTRPFLGHYTEYTWMTDEIWGRMGGPPAASTS